MKVAMLGLKGLPGIHGGVEKHVEELGARLADRGHDVTVFCRKFYTPEEGMYRGMKMVLAPTIHSKHLDATVHTLIGGFSAAFQDFDLIHYHAIGPSSMSLIPRAFGKPVIATIHSLDFLRDKWNPAVKWALKRAEQATLLFAKRVIVVSRLLEQRYHNSKTPIAYIPNGVQTPVKREPGWIHSLGVQGDDYILYVGRISPEKGPHYLAEAFSQIETDKKLILVGGTSHTDDYLNQVRSFAEKDQRIIMPGYVSGEKLDELYTNASLFVLPSEHEGLPVALLEAMSFGVPCISSDIPQCREVAQSMIGYFQARNPKALADALIYFLSRPDGLKQGAALAEKHVLEHYHWDTVAKQVETEYEALLGAKS